MVTTASSIFEASAAKSTDGHQFSKALLSNLHPPKQATPSYKAICRNIGQLCRNFGKVSVGANYPNITNPFLVQIWNLFTLGAAK